MSSVAAIPLTAESGEFIQSLERGLAVLRVFGADAPSLTLSDAARRAGITRATARRVLHTLVALGYVTFDGKRFELTARVLDIGYAYLSSLHLSDLAQPTMEALSERLNESVSAAVLDGDEIVYVARVPTTRILTISLGLGSRLPAHCTSLGRVLLAGLPVPLFDEYIERVQLTPRTVRSVVDKGQLRSIVDDVRARGYALLDQELEDGVRSVAAPLHDRQGRVIAALNVGTQASRTTVTKLRSEIVPELLSATATISDLLAKR
jgi:IclR family transcriptional regulator, pca regulon regulatory protein